MEVGVMFKMGWFSTGRDEAARDLLKTVYFAIKHGTIPDAKILYVFCNRDEGESEESDKFIKLAEKEFGIITIPLSSARFERELKKENLELWRKEYDRLVAKLINFPYPNKVDVIILAGYMLIVSEELCQKYPMINLHPAAPGGPKGTWQKVIWQLMENKARKSGVTIHLVTPELDAGPPITFCKYRIKEYDFDKIRQQGLKRELPLIVETLRLLSIGEIKIKDVKEGGHDLTKLINKKIRSRQLARLLFVILTFGR